ncbi:hypothetical protein NE237_017231 [Protea cynaroides]|uniref:O-fucosyltransferase family protein n=1 Tax=Protea cynaroides TaxID=273540 RepID=A0A9Q0QMP2_9MAGN|nr:hypothetical protein NE237_017231 [Protea cynaroides]
MKSKIKWAALVGLVLSLLSLLVPLLLANYSTTDLVQYSAMVGLREDFTPKFGKESIPHRKLWGVVKTLQSLQPFANPRSTYPWYYFLRTDRLQPRFSSLTFTEHTMASPLSIFGGFEKIRSSICDLVTITRLLNDTLVIPEIQGSTHSKGISAKFQSFSYLYNEEQFIAALSNDVIIVKSLPDSLKEARKRKVFPLFKPKSSVIGLVLTNGGCLQLNLPPSLFEYQRLRCWVAFHALHFRPEIQALGHRIVERNLNRLNPTVAIATARRWLQQRKEEENLKKKNVRRRRKRRRRREMRK